MGIYNHNIIAALLLLRYHCADLVTERLQCHCDIERVGLRHIVAADCNLTLLCITLCFHLYSYVHIYVCICICKYFAFLFACISAM